MDEANELLKTKRLAEKRDLPVNFQKSIIKKQAHTANQD